MKTKSISSCILGIIFSIIGALCAYAFNVVFIFLTIALKQNPYVFLITYVNIGAYVISFIGAIISSFNAKVSGIIMCISSIINLIFLAVICIWLKEMHLLIILFWLPAIFILITGLNAIKKAKKEQKKS